LRQNPPAGDLKQFLDLLEDDMAFRIYPSIGIARVGNDLTQFYIGSEIPGHPGFDVDDQGNETPITQYKVDDDQIKRQAARFRLFEVDGGVPRPAQLPAGAAVRRDSGPPANPTRPRLVANPAQFLIDPGPRSIAGASASGVKFDTGAYQGRQVPLGELRTDKNQNLLVLGGFGFSSSPTNQSLPSFYTNPGWHDDTSDGPVTARIRLADGSTIDDITPAWVAVGPPDYAPEIQGVVSLYDIMLQVAIDQLGVPRPNPVSFTRDIFPMLLRTRRYQWVNQGASPGWETVSDDWPALASTSAASAALRGSNAEFVRNIESVLSSFHLTGLQHFQLQEWVAGRFQSDWQGVPQPGHTVTADGMTRAALQSTVGQGFFPGIEAGIIVKDPTLYSVPFDFRLDHGQARPGDLTALMALPWQADFMDCAGNWWPSQRPDIARPVASSANTLLWARGVTTHLEMVHNFPKLGFITAQKDAAGNIVFAEDQRAPSDRFA
jgi:L-Lysine epsilon oxidase N-terminal/L-lysine epsilon oxidase C-terminal domain